MTTTTTAQAAQTPGVIDEAAGVTGQGYTLTRVYRHGSLKIRVRVVRDSYQRQSHAAAEVLSTLLTWTQLVDDPPCNWHGDTGYAAATPADAVRELAGVADALARRAATVLD
jgi:hypothetical protein